MRPAPDSERRWGLETPFLSVGAESGNEEESTQQESSGEEVILGDPDQSPEFKDPSEMPLETPSQDASGPQDAPAPLGHANPSDHQTPLDTPSN